MIRQEITPPRTRRRPDSHAARRRATRAVPTARASHRSRTATRSPPALTAADLPPHTTATRAADAQKSAEHRARKESQDPLVTISPEGKITDANEATIRVTGVERGRLVGTDFADYFTEPDRARESYRQVFAQGSVTGYPLTIRHTGGDLTDVLYNASLYRDTDGNALGVVAAARDVTAQKRAEREVARQRARELDRLAELERFQKLTVGRELRMIELKKEIEDLRAAAGSS